MSVTDGPSGAMVQDQGREVRPADLERQRGGYDWLWRRVFRIEQRRRVPRASAALVTLVGSIGAAAMTQRRCNESPVTEQEFMTIGKIVI